MLYTRPEGSRAYAKDSAVNVRVRWAMETAKHALIVSVFKKLKLDTMRKSGRTGSRPLVASGVAEAEISQRDLSSRDKID